MLTWQSIFILAAYVLFEGLRCLSLRLSPLTSPWRGEEPRSVPEMLGTHVLPIGLVLAMPEGFPVAAFIAYRSLRLPRREVRDLHDLRVWLGLLPAARPVLAR